MNSYPCKKQDCTVKRVIIASNISVQFISLSYRFWQKSCQIIGFCPKRSASAPYPGLENPVVATGKHVLLACGWLAPYRKDFLLTRIFTDNPEKWQILNEENRIQYYVHNQWKHYNKTNRKGLKTSYWVYLFHCYLSCNFVARL